MPIILHGLYDTLLKKEHDTAALVVAMLSFAWLLVSRWMSVRQKIVHATPAWMIPIVGTLNISIVGVTLDVPGAQAVSAFGLAVGLFFAVPLFTLVLSRLIFEEPMLKAQWPSLLIFVATFAVSFWRS